MSEFESMPRTKNYNEQEVVEKAMNLFWRNGYETTSMQMLEKEMGINKFSIYSSFGSKDGLFMASLKCYKQKLYKLIDDLKASPSSIAGIKHYFYEFIEFTKVTDFGKGCLITNTANEIREDCEDCIKDLLSRFTNEVKEVFAEKLRKDNTKTEALIEQQADYLLISMFGLSSATRIFTRKQLENYIENIFKDL